MKKEIPDSEIRFAILAVDIAILSIRNGVLVARFVKVNRPPHFVNIGGLPGGLIKPNETATAAAVRLVGEKSGIDNKNVYLEQLATFSEVDRDPRGRVVSVAYLGLVAWDDLSEEEKVDTDESWWGRAVLNSKLAYDHNKILDFAVSKLRSKIHNTTISSKIISKEFTLTELESTFEQIIGADIDKRNFRKKIDKIKILKPLNRMRTGMKHRPAALYSFVSTKVIDIEGI